ncbi:hypothetical protein [Clostridium estertheticum]|nr:hypothetical protein [Clostridium estertheticum]
MEVEIIINTGFIFTESSTFDLEEFWDSIGWTVIPDKTSQKNI